MPRAGGITHDVAGVHDVHAVLVAATPDAARLSGESLVRTGHFDDEESAPRKGAPDGYTDVDAGLMTRAVGTDA
jgi:hypothetical protein